MTNLSETRKAPKRQLFEEIDRARAGMLFLEGARLHAQPMATFIDAESDALLFFAKRDSELVKHLGTTSDAHFIVVGKDQDYHACVRGTLQESNVPAKIDQHWNSMVDAWFDGKDDPNMTLLQMTLSDGMIWASSGNAVRFGWEMLKAKMGDGEPDVGVKVHIAFGPGSHAEAV